ncbi:MAG TPA: hypothetical protein VIG48_04385 [Jatrophihabitans sp.]
MRLVLGVLAGIPLLAGCSAVAATAPRCGDTERLGLVAQTVPSAGYVPCVAGLAAGWRSSGFTAQNGSTRFDLVSDRAPGYPVTVALRPSCGSTAGATPIPPRTPGGRTYLTLASIDPRYAGTMYDQFPGGCVSYRFDFARGPHIALMAQLAAAVGFVPRAQLRLRLRALLGVDPG